MKPTSLFCGLTAAVLAGCAAQPREPQSAAPAPTEAASASSTDPSSPLSPAQKAARRESLELLQAGRYADLDTRMNAFQQAYRSRALDDLELLREFGAFARTDSLLQSNLDSWVQEYPNSYAAHLARGIYYFKCGVVTRGKKYISRTPVEQIRGMTVYLTQAREDLLASLALDAVPLISYHYLIVIGMEFGERDRNRDWLDKATALDPDSIVIRRPYMVSLETRWGGSLDAMQEFLDVSRQAGTSPDHLRMLAELIERERKWLHKKPAEAAASDTDDPS
ncbi:MAG TPA: DUF4034 domain-containing protein [Steroidobacteraceae bacterium]|nr:DUF4034 domain-containing protein [Steroidobacteraceae bacterium]